MLGSLNSRAKPPSADEIEVSLFGPGYGESVVIHVGNGDWIIVDSSIDAQTRNPAALTYLSDIGVDPARDIKLIVASHWHDDHIRGLAEIVRSAGGAAFVCSAAMQSAEFLTLAELSTQDPMMTTSGVTEFKEILNGLDARSPVFAIGERLLFRRDTGPAVQIFCLTPSDEAFRAAQQQIAKLIPLPREPKRRVPAITPNHASVVLHVTVGDICILLGGDLEENPGRRWSAVVGSSTRPSSKASLFKIPHHGSSTAECSGVWTHLLDQDVVALLSPFQRGSVSRPTPTDIERICHYTKRAYSTSGKTRSMPIRREKSVERTLKEIGVRIVPANSPMGQARARRTINSTAPWAVELFDPGVALCA